MTGTEDVPLLCWRCGGDAGPAFDLVRVRGVFVAVHKPGTDGCLPTIAKETR